MTRPDAHTKTFTGNAGKAKGREFIRRNGERGYINHSPYFVVRYYPLEQPERVWYQTWENDVHLVGRNLLAVYDDLKANTPKVWQESDGPQDAEHPYIETIEFRLRL
jgi:hypothetical protein